MNRKVESFKQIVLISIVTVCDVKSYNKCSKSSLLASTQTHNYFPTRLLLCR